MSEDGRDERSAPSPGGEGEGAPPPGPDAEAELERLYERVSRIRHDINNPLTAVLAEAQLLLLDYGEGDEELASSLRVIEEQARRIRDLVAHLSEIRPPRSPEEG